MQVPNAWLGRRATQHESQGKKERRIIVFRTESNPKMIRMPGPTSWTRRIAVVLFLLIFKLLILLRLLGIHLRGGLFEISNSLAETAADLRKFARSKYDQYN